MSAKQLSRRLETLSIRVAQEAIRLERLQKQTSDLVAACDEISIPYDDDFSRKSAIQQDATKRLHGLSWTLSEVESSLSEAAWSIDAIVDLVDELAPPARTARTYDPPDAWK